MGKLILLCVTMLAAPSASIEEVERHEYVADTWGSIRRLLHNLRAHNKPLYDDFIGEMTVHLAMAEKHCPLTKLRVKVWIDVFRPAQGRALFNVIGLAGGSCINPDTKTEWSLGDAYTSYHVDDYYDALKIVTFEYLR